MDDRVMRFGSKNSDFFRSNRGLNLFLIAVVPRSARCRAPAFSAFERAFEGTGRGRIDARLRRVGCHVVQRGGLCFVVPSSLHTASGIGTDGSSRHVIGRYSIEVFGGADVGEVLSRAARPVRMASFAGRKSQACA